MFRIVYWFPQALYSVNRFVVEYELVGTTSSSRAFLGGISLVEISVCRIENFYSVSTTQFSNETENRSVSQFATFQLDYQVSPEVLLNWYYTRLGDSTRPYTVHLTQIEFQ